MLKFKILRYDYNEENRPHQKQAINISIILVCIICTAIISIASMDEPNIKVSEDRFLFLYSKQSKEDAILRNYGFYEKMFVLPCVCWEGGGGEPQNNI